MRIVLPLLMASILAVAVGSTPARADSISATNAFNVVQAAGANYVPAAGPVACNGGTCTTSLNPVTVTDLGAMTAANTAGLAADLAAQRAGFSIANPGGLGAQLDINFVVTKYKAYQDGSTAGGILVVDYTNPRNAVLPTGLHWVQIVTDNSNLTGVNGANLNAPKGPGKPENVVDAPNTPNSPYYDVSSLANNPSFNTNPPHFEDFSSRNDPTAANPSINWNATLFLVSDPGNSQMTVYDAVQWGWVASYAPPVVPPVGGGGAVPEPATWTLVFFGMGAVWVIRRHLRLAPRTAQAR